jgi:hypothetical protein
LTLWGIFNIRTGFWTKLFRLVYMMLLVFDNALI